MPPSDFLLQLADAGFKQRLHRLGVGEALVPHFVELARQRLR